MNLIPDHRCRHSLLDQTVHIGSETYFARCFDWRGYEFSKRAFRFTNTQVGFLSFIRWVEEMVKKAEKSTVIVGCEPTGCYWLTFQKFLADRDILLVTVNPYSVRSTGISLKANTPSEYIDSYYKVVETSEKGIKGSLLSKKEKETLQEKLQQLKKDFQWQL